LCGGAREAQEEVRALRKELVEPGVGVDREVRGRSSARVGGPGRLLPWPEGAVAAQAELCVLVQKGELVAEEVCLCEESLTVSRR
jgi:hypothetical protein